MVKDFQKVISQEARPSPLEKEAVRLITVIARGVAV